MKDTSPVLAMILMAFTCAIHAQTTDAPAFEVASIKVDRSGGNYVELTPLTLTVHSGTLATCIIWAYGIQRSQLSGGNATVLAMLDSERYEIVAKTAQPVPEGQRKLMMQRLLAERFKLTMHRQTRDVKVYALTVDKNGPRLAVSPPDAESKQQARSKMVRRWTATGMRQLADSLSDATQVPVLDETGLGGRYDFSLDLTPYLTDGPGGGEKPDLTTIMLTAVREQLGLRLESRRAKIEVLTVDSVENPSAN